MDEASVSRLLLRFQFHDQDELNKNDLTTVVCLSEPVKYFTCMSVQERVQVDIWDNYEECSLKAALRVPKIITLTTTVADVKAW